MCYLNLIPDIYEDFSLWWGYIDFVRGRKDLQQLGVKPGKISWFIIKSLILENFELL